MENEIKNDQELYSYFVGRNQTLCEDNFSFLMEHPEIKQMLNDYLSNILLHKPDDVFKFTQDYFKILSEKGQSDKFIVLVGPNSVGKSTLIEMLTEEFPQKFIYPRLHTTRKEDSFSQEKQEHFYFIQKEEFLELMNKGELITYIFDSKDKEYEGVTKSEVDRIKEEGMVRLFFYSLICIIEIDIAGAKKINSSSYGANFIGVLPPSIDDLRERVKKHTKFNTETINKILEKSGREIKEIEVSSFFAYRIINDNLETGYKDFKNCILSLFPDFKSNYNDVENLIEKTKFSHS